VKVSHRQSPLPIAVLISGQGTTLRNLIDTIGRHELAAQIKLVISSNPQAGGLAFAAKAGIETRIAQRRDYDSPNAFSAAIFDPCRAAAVELVVMGGFLKHVLIPADFFGRVMNIHPALVPSFCGKGLYGTRVHQAVLAYGAKITGCTVHFVDNQYDHGPVILQRTVPVLADDTPASLAARVFAEECLAYPEAIRLFGEGRLHLEGRRVKIHESGIRTPNPVA
jgi:phosphoribosylglycinamide formyltransferase-1